MESEIPRFSSHGGLNFELKCDKHEYYSASCFPCPWPNCSNGVKSPKIIEESFGIKEITHHRTRFISIDQQERYYWMSEDMPHVFFAGNVADGEIRRLTKIYKDTRSLIYHYTTMEGFSGIVKDKGLWLTDHLYLNDYKEIEYGINIVSEMVDSFLSKENILQKLFLDLKKELFNTNEYRVCISCFSLDGNNLSQWRGYGQHGNGVSLGFSTSNPLIFGHVQETFLSKVIYNEREQKKIINIILNQFSHSFSIDLENWRWGGNVLDTTTSLALSRIHKFIVAFKDSSFKDEKEVRYFYTENPDFIKEGFFSKAEKEFRIVNGVMVPYVTTNSLYENNKLQMMGQENDSLSPNNNFPLEEVIIGPHYKQELVERGIREFLDYHDLNHVKIKKSPISYRN
jgi:hypothetical protein